MSRRKWELNVEDPSRWQYVIGEEPRRYYLRQSNFTLNYLAYFIENFEDTFERKARILEYGSGCTSVWWGINFPDNEYIGVEGDQWWMKSVQEELDKNNCKNARLIYHEASENYTTVEDASLDYTHTIDEVGGSFDLIINDGAQREIIGDHILTGIDQGKEYLSPGGLYLRHDYEMAVLGNWVGLRKELPTWCRDKMDLGYNGFAATHPEYEHVTVCGNHIASMVIEMGGIWRMKDFKWTQRLNSERKAKENDNN